MNTVIRFVIILAVVIWFDDAAFASLKWEQTQVELHPALGDATAVGSFKYRNDGKQPVHIRSVHTSCGCTTTSRQKDEVAPGESGEITATFKIGSSTGLQQKTVQVETDDPAEPTTVLTLRAVVPQAVEVRPSFVFWQNGEPSKPKSISVSLAKELGAKNVKATSSSPEFTTKVSANGANNFTIEVQPKDTSHLASATVTIQPDNGAKPAFATVRVLNPASGSR